MENVSENITLNGIEFPSGNQGFRQKFFQNAGWGIHDLERICSLQLKIPAEVTFSPVKTKGFWGIQPGDSEKTIRKVLGKPAFILHDSFWNPSVTLMIYETFIGQLKMKLQLVIFNNQLEIAVLDPRNPMILDSQVYKMMQHFFGPVEFFSQPYPGDAENIFYIMRDVTGRTLILERYFTLRVHFLSEKISTCNEIARVSIPA